jgi:hypothetical protein
VLEILLNNELDGEEADVELILAAMPIFVRRDWDKLRQIYDGLYLNRDFKPGPPK